MDANEQHVPAQQLYDFLNQLPTPPTRPPTEDLVDDNQIITEQNHPLYTTASFIGKTWGVMKQMENNRINTDFFTSQDLDQQLRELCTCLQRTCGTIDVSNFDQCISTWQENPSEGLNLSGPIGLGGCFLLDSIPEKVHTLIVYSWYKKVNFPITFTKRKNLVSLAICAYPDAIPVMPYIQILHLQLPDYDSEQNTHTLFDFSKWTNLRVLKLTVKSTHQIRLPAQLMSLTLCVNNPSGSTNGYTYTFENMFGKANDQRVIFQSLKHLHINLVNWPTLPKLLNCQYFTMEYCNKLQTVEVPKCRSVRVNRCKLFSGFGPLTLLHNNTLDTIILNKLRKDKYYQLPLGSPTGYRHVEILFAHVSALPTHFAPYAYISIMDAGSKLFIKDQHIRDTLEFYFDRTQLTYFDYDDSEFVSSDLSIPREGETLREMISRFYGFDWPKFAKKLQRQFRFKRYMKNLHKPLLKHVTTQDICIHEIAQYLGASNTFKNTKK